MAFFTITRLDPSISLVLATLEVGSLRLMVEASTRSRAAPSTLARAAGMSCLRTESSLFEIISRPTCGIAKTSYGYDTYEFASFIGNWDLGKL